MHTIGLIYRHGQVKTWKEAKNMAKKNLIKAKMAENETNYEECSTKLGIAVKSFYNKINGVTSFKLEEVMLLSTHLKLTDNEIVNIFFN